MSLESQFIDFINDDSEEIASQTDTAIKSIKKDIFVDEDGKDVCDVSVKFDKNGKIYALDWTYLVDGDDILMDISIDDLVNTLNHRIDRSIKSNSKIQRNHKSIKSSKKAIFAAEGDDEEFESDDFSFAEESTDDSMNAEDDSFDDTLDEVSDQIEDLQDSVDELQEDDVNIDMNNNIDNHYIAECDMCHNVFITSLVESDQEVDSISGVCPICGKESTQYINWVIKDVNEDE